MILDKLKGKISPTKITNWYGRYERPISSLSLIGGFVFDALTLRRVDMFWENFWVIGHIVVVAVLIILVHAIENEPGDEANPEKTHFWLVNTLQFVFGGLLSVFLVFYFRSAELSSNWPFILILSIAFWANESMKRRFVRLNFQLSLFFFSLFCCSIFLVPVIFHRIGAGIFIISGFISLLVMILFLHVLVRYSKAKFYENRKVISASILGIYFLINVLYFTNLIPPIPLSLKDSGVFHSIDKQANGSYIAKYEDFGWRSALQVYTSFHAKENDTVYAYSSVFAPSSLNLTIVHQWQHYDSTAGRWIDADKVDLPVVGGREGGFRTYSVKSGLAAGLWRVNVETTGGQIIGRLRFEIVRTSTTPIMQAKTLE